MLKFRKAQECDIEKIEQIYIDTHRAEEEGIIETGWIRGVYPVRKTAELALARGDLFVAEAEDSIVGVAIINQLQLDEYKGAPWQYSADDEELMVLHTLVISPKEFGKGYGKKFVEFYEKYSLEKGCRFLRMDTNARNKRARAMYKNLGYTEIGSVGCSFNGIDGVQLILLEKKL